MKLTKHSFKKNMCICVPSQRKGKTVKLVPFSVSAIKEIKIFPQEAIENITLKH